MSATPATVGASSRRVQLRAFGAMCERDAWVTVRYEFIAFLAQALLQPLFFLFIFGRVLPEIGSASAGYGNELMPGVMALTLVLTSLQNTALPLVIEFGFTREIEDRLLAPLPIWSVAWQKCMISSARGMVAAIVILPLAEVVLPGGVHVAGAHWWAWILILIFGSLLASAMGLVLGTSVAPNRISIAFAIVLTPLIFTGATFYPWKSLHSLPWFQVVTLLNPMTYVSEGMRAALTHDPHMGAGYIALGIGVSLIVFGALGTRGFVRRAVD
jgi:ABC-2 type transport system permease protein